MDDSRSCRCPICQLEQKLLSWPPDQTNPQHFQELINRFPALVQFRSTSEVLSWLHQEGLLDESIRTADQLIHALLQPEACPGDSIHKPLLILIFIPTIHKTFRDICVSFPAIPLDDVAQQALTAFLELCDSRNLLRRTHHLAVYIAGDLRKEMFRWATKEARNTTQFESLSDPSCPAHKFTCASTTEDSVQLSRLLDRCETSAGLSNGDRILLTKVKVEGFEPTEIARANGRRSSNAVRVRVKRIVARVRHAASTKPYAGQCVPKHNRRISPARSCTPVVKASA